MQKHASSIERLEKQVRGFPNIDLGCKEEDTTIGNHTTVSHMIINYLSTDVWNLSCFIFNHEVKYATEHVIYISIKERRLKTEFGSEVIELKSKILHVSGCKRKDDQSHERKSDR